MASPLNSSPTEPSRDPFAIPLAVADTPAPAVSDVPPNSVSVLLVDDEERSLASLRAVLEPLRQRIVSVTSGQQALRCLLEDEFAVVLLDMRMPGLDGVETARYISARGRTRHTPIIFLTAYGEDVEQAFRAYAAGAVDYVAKPLHPDVLRSKVAVFIQLHHARRQQVREARARAEAEAVASTVGKLQSFADAALAHLELDELLPELLQRIQAVLRADTAGMLLSDVDEGLPTLVAHDGSSCVRTQPAPPELVRLLDAPLHREALSLKDSLDPATLGRELGRLDLSSLIAAPLSAHGRVLGSIFVCARDGRSFADSDAVLLGLCAERAAIAVEHACSFDRERGLVELLQRHLLPDHLPGIPGIELAALYRPSERVARVGGDWYDAMVLPHGCVGIAIGDVVGHGVAAAAVMSELRSALRAYVMADALSPAAALTSLNVLAAQTHKEMVATLLYMVIDPEADEVRFASAGHPPPLLVAADGTARYLEHSPAPPLGVTMHSRFQDAVAEFGAGATILLYTDGVVERRGEPLDAGLKRLQDAVRDGPAELDALCSSLLRLPLESGVADDAALLALRRLEQAARLDVTVPAEPESLAFVRYRLQHWLEDCGADADDRFAITVAANEACANAVVHAYGPRRGPMLSLVGTRSDGSITVEVTDTGRWRAPRRPGGRGLYLMRRLMDDVDVEHDERGTKVRMRKGRAAAA
jgi:serine phosphatase RsbU (regulator of sigma subunit)/DNA-binding response OmpR family regulator/anti-sigma regulatory factor (Ser/Thr protein kinase)